MLNAEMIRQIAGGNGFIAALDQSGGSTPKALGLYGISAEAWKSEAEMFDLVHAMRCRIIQSAAFGSDRVIGAILFEQTMDRMVDGLPTASYLWDKLHVVPFLKIDKGLAPAENGVQLMKPIPDLDALLARAVKAGIFGTKERSVIGAANNAGIEAAVAQQFDLGQKVLAHGLMPILEPEVSIDIPDKEAAEQILLASLLRGLNALPADQQVMLKLTLPSVANFYAPLVDHPRVLKVVALSGGYSRNEANDLLSRNRGMIASFSRALTEGLSVTQSNQEFDATLQAAVNSIHAASIAG